MKRSCNFVRKAVCLCLVSLLTLQVYALEGESTFVEVDDIGTRKTTASESSKPEPPPKEEITPSEPEPQPTPTPEPQPQPEPDPVNPPKEEIEPEQPDTPDPESKPSGEKPKPDERVEKEKYTVKKESYSETAKSILDLINEERAAKGIGPLEWDDTLAKCANIRSSELTDDDEQFRHARPDDRDWSTVLKECNVTGWISAGENLASLTTEGYQADKQLWFEGWKSSPGHYALMTNPNFNKIGVAVNAKWFNRTGVNDPATGFYSVAAITFGQF